MWDKLKFWKRADKVEKPSTITYSIFDNGDVEVDISIEKITDDNVDNFGIMLAELSSDIYTVKTMEILKEALYKADRKDVFIRIIASTVNRMHELKNISEKEEDDELCVDPLDIL